MYKNIQGHRIKAVWAQKGHQTVLWKYFTFSKFIDLLEHKKLFFSLADDFEDATEVSRPQDQTLVCYSNKRDCIITRSNDAKPMPMPEDCKKEENAHFDMEILKRYCGINCWRMADEESYAMWKIYTDPQNGIAIKTTLEKLDNSIIPGPNKLLAGEVSYYDGKQASPGAFSPFFCKLKHYISEDEFRLISISKENYEAVENNQKELLSGEYPKFISLNSVEDLIEELYISPYAEDWFRTLVKDVVTSRYGLDILIAKSEIKLKIK